MTLSRALWQAQKIVRSMRLDRSAVPCIMHGFVYDFARERLLHIGHDLKSREFPGSSFFVASIMVNIA